MSRITLVIFWEIPVMRFVFQRRIRFRKSVSELTQIKICRRSDGSRYKFSGRLQLLPRISVQRFAKELALV